MLKKCHTLCFGTSQSRWIFKTMVQPFRCTEEYRTSLFGIITYGNDVIEILPLKFIYMLRALTRYINVQLSHNGDSFRSHNTRLCSSAFHIAFLSSVMSQQPFRHLAAC